MHVSRPLLMTSVLWPKLQVSLFQETFPECPSLDASLLGVLSLFSTAQG